MKKRQGVFNDFVNINMALFKAAGAIEIHEVFHGFFNGLESVFDGVDFFQGFRVSVFVVLHEIHQGKDSLER